MNYDTTGQVVSTADISGNSTTFSYTDSYYTDSGSSPNGSGSSAPSSCTPSGLTNAFASTITPPLIGAITLGHYCNTGKLAVETDQNSQSSVFHYLDGVNWDRPSTSYFPAGGWVLYNYAIAQLDTYTGITSSTVSTSCSPGCLHNQTVLDNWGRISTSSLESDLEGEDTLTATYGASGRLLTLTNPARSQSSPTDGTQTVAYDGLSRTTQITDQDSSKAYTYFGSQVAANGGNSTQTCSSTTYGLGYPVLYVDEAGKKRQTWNNAFGNVIETDEPDPANNNALDLATCSQYDAEGHLLQVAQGSQTRSYTYDWVGRLTQSVTPESGTVTFSLYGSCSGNIYVVCKRTDARGISASYTYDGLYRLTKISYSDSTPTVTYSYDSTSCPVPGYSLYTYGKGRRTGMMDGSGSTAWCYDKGGRIVAEQRTIAGFTNNITYSYNEDGSLATITYPSGRTITYTTTDAGRLKSAQDSANNIQYAMTASYAPPGELQSVLYGPATGFNGISQNNYFNSRLEPCRLSATTPSATPPQKCTDTNNGNDLDLAFNFSLPTGNDGSINAITNNVNSGLGESFTYDALSRIVTGATSSNSASGCWGETFGASGVPDDRYSNLSQIGVTQCAATGLTVAASSTTNQITTTGYTYDSAGNMTQEASAVSYTYQYDAENRLISANGMTNGPHCYVYDGNGLRVEKYQANGGTCASPTNKVVEMLYWRAITGQTIAETDGSDNLKNEYVFFGGQRIASRNGSTGAVNYYYQDQLGSTVTITDGSGNPCYEATFTPYGQEMPSKSNWTCSSDYKFTGYERDSETGLDYAFARYYNSRLGRFMSADLLAGDVSNPQTLNRYTYVLNNPTNLTDPLGLYCAKGLQCHQQPFDPSNLGNYDASSEGVGWIGQPFAESWNDCTYYGVETYCIMGLMAYPYDAGTQQGGNSSGGRGNASDFITKHDCVGKGRVIGAGRVTNPPSNGAFGVPVTAGTAAINPTQFFPGMSMLQAKAALAPYLNTMSGVVSDTNPSVPLRAFNGVTDVIGPGSARASLAQRFPGPTIEINGVAEPPGASTLSDVLLTMSIFVPCPKGTTELIAY
jgi:RHS repeat-associated protein